MGTYLGAVDLVTQNQLTIVARIGINPSDRQLGDVSPGLATIFVSNGSTSSRSVGSLVATEFNVTTSVVDNMGGKKFSTEPLSLPVYSTPQNNGYATFNQQVGLNFGSMSLTAVDNLTSQLFDAPGSYNWTVPSGVTSISVAGIGGGGGGAQKSGGGSGGGGGLITYSNSIAVTPGTTCTIVVGSGGATGGTYGVNGSSTYLLLPGTNVPIVIAQGGAGGDSIFWLLNSIGASYVDVTGTITTQTAFDPAGGAITYSVSAGSLPTGASLNTSTGTISWVRQNLLSTTEYAPFTLSASNGSQTITKSFTLKILLNTLTSTVEYLVVAGGASGGGWLGGGGGAGGYRTASGFAVVAGTPIIVTVGAGGAAIAAAASAVQGNSGTNSVFSSIISIGGGRGGSYPPATYPGGSGGSGGGGGDSGVTTTGGAGAGLGTSGQGNNGGAGIDSSGGAGGGGGGAGAVGSSVPNGPFTPSGYPSGADGGVGLSSSITGTATYYSGGGGGGCFNQGTKGGNGGDGGGGGGSTYSGGTNSTGGSNGGGSGLSGGNAGAGGPNSGGGGGGSNGTASYNRHASGAGGSGIVVIRYPSVYNTATTTTGTQTTLVTSLGYHVYTFLSSGSITF